MTALKADMALFLNKNERVEAGLAYNLATLIPPHHFSSGLMRALEHRQQSRGEFSTVLQNWGESLPTLLELVGEHGGMHAAQKRGNNAT